MSHIKQQQEQHLEKQQQQLEKQVKCVWQFHDKKDELQQVFDSFRFMTNEGIRIGDEKNITSRFSLQRQVYRDFQDQNDFHSHYVHGALICSTARLKLYRKTKKKRPNAKRPYVKRDMIQLESQMYKIQDDGLMRIVLRAKEYIFIKLASYVLKQLEGGSKIGSITVTPEKLIISYSKEVLQKTPTEFVGIDRNLDNATSFDSGGKFMVYNLSRANQIKSKYKKVKSHFTRNDVRIRKKLFSKYGKKEKNRVHQLLHNASKKIVSKNQGIVLEDIKGIRKLYRKGNGQGSKYRGRMNSWSYYELQRQIEYKAKWAGLPVRYVRAAGTSSKCAVCGVKVIPEEHRKMWCPKCHSLTDRDINAARNILARGMRFVPDGSQVEAVKQSKDAEQIVVSKSPMILYN